jgi:PAS domain S-box-containing protein
MTHHVDSRIAAGLELAKIGFYRYLLDGTVLSMDRTTFDFLELEDLFDSPEAVLGKKIGDLIVYTGPAGRVRQEIREKGHALGLAYHFKTLKGTERWGLHNSYLLVDEKTGLEAVQVCFYDVTRTKQIELALREINERYESLVSTIPHGIVETNAAGEILFANDTFSRMAELPPKKIIGRPLTEFFVRDYLYDLFTSKFGHPFNRDSGEFCAELKLAGAKGKTSEVDVRWKRKTSERQPDGGFVAVLTDLSERSQLEALLQDRQRMDSVAVLLSGISHDFNNVLASINSLAELIRFNSSNLTATQRGAVDSIFQTIGRATDLIGNIHSATGPRTGRMAHFDLHKVAAELFGMLERTTSQGIEKKLDFGPGEHFVFADESDLYQILANLSTNAVRAINAADRGEGGVMRLAVVTPTTTAGDSGRENAGYVHVIFEDNGCGMNQQTRANAFLPFYSTKAKDQTKGQGLGLASAYYVITKKHGGFIEIESEPGKGTKIHLYLPRGAPHHQESQREKPTPILKAVKGQSKGLVLVVEDEDTIRRFLDVVLQRFGYQVLTASDGGEGLELYKQNRESVEFVIVDYSMPVLSGGELMQRIRDLSPEAKVIVMSGHAQEELHDIAGAVAFLKKPFSLETLAGTIEPLVTND